LTLQQKQKHNNSCIQKKRNRSTGSQQGLCFRQALGNRRVNSVNNQYQHDRKAVEESVNNQRKQKQSGFAILPVVQGQMPAQTRQGVPGARLLAM